MNIKKYTYRYMAAFQITTRSFDGLMYVVVIVAGGIFMIQGKVEPGDLVAYTMYVTTLLTTIRRIIEFAADARRVRGIGGDGDDRPAPLATELGHRLLKQVERPADVDR